MKEYRICRYYPSGNVVFCGVFKDFESARSAMCKLMEKNPAAMYRIHEREPR